MKLDYNYHYLILILFLIPALAVTSCNSSIEGDTLEEAKQKGYANLKVLYVPADGFAYRDEYGTLTGVTIEIMDEFADFVNYSHGIELRYDFVPFDDWSYFYRSVVESRGGVFGLGNVTITESRKDELRFSPPYLTNVAVLISHESVESLPDLSEIGEHFSDMTALAFEGTLHESRLVELSEVYWQDMPMDYANSNAEIIQRLTDNDSYFSYIDIYNYWRAAEQGSPLKQHTAGDMASERFGVIMPLNTDWDRLIADFFERGQGFRTSQTYRDILERHLGPELTEKLERARIMAEEEES